MEHSAHIHLTILTTQRSSISQPFDIAQTHGFFRRRSFCLLLKRTRVYCLHVNFGPMEGNALVD